MGRRGGGARLSVRREGPRGRLWWAGLALGSVAMARGLAGLASQARSTVPPAWAAWLAGVLLAHDLLVVPAVLAVTALTGRAPAAWRGGLRAALAVSCVLVLVTLPAFLGHGRATQPGNATVLPSDYPRNLAALVALVWLLAGARVLLAGRRRRR